MPQHAGYSGTPLVRKLGFKAGFRIKLYNPPDGYEALLAPAPDGLVASSRLRGQVDAVHLFTTRQADLQRLIASGRTQIPDDGMIWVSWPKKSSGVPSEVTEDTVRAVALPTGLVDVKVCAVDATWSGLKLVIRKELRA